MNSCDKEVSKEYGREISNEDRSALKSLLQEALGSENTSPLRSSHRVKTASRSLPSLRSRPNSSEKESSDEIENTPVLDIEKSKFKTPRSTIIQQSSTSNTSKSYTSKYFHKSRKCGVTKVSMYLTSSTQSSISTDSANEFMWKLRNHQPIPFQGIKNALKLPPALSDITEESLRSSTVGSKLSRSEIMNGKNQHNSPRNPSPEVKRKVSHLKYAVANKSIHSPTKSDSGLGEGSQDNMTENKTKDCFVPMKRCPNPESKLKDVARRLLENIEQTDIDIFFKENTVVSQQELSPSEIRKMNMSSPSDSDLDMRFDQEAVEECLKNLIDMVCENLSESSISQTRPGQRCSSSTQHVDFSTEQILDAEMKTPPANVSTYNENSSPKTPIKSPKQAKSLYITPLLSGKKRKLYSPKDSDISHLLESPTVAEIPSAEKYIHSNAVSYKDIEQDRSIKKKTLFKRSARKRAAIPKCPKSDLENEKDKNPNKSSPLEKRNDIYNMSSSSDSEADFKPGSKVSMIRKKKQPKRKVKERLCYNRSPTKVEKMFDELKATNEADSECVVLPSEVVWNASSDSDDECLPKEKETVDNKNKEQFDSNIESDKNQKVNEEDKENAPIKKKKRKGSKKKKVNKKKIVEVEVMRATDTNILDCSLIELEPDVKTNGEKNTKRVPKSKSYNMDKSDTVEDLFSPLPVEVVEQQGNADDSIVSNLSKIVKNYLEKSGDSDFTLPKDVLSDNDGISDHDVLDKVSYTPEQPLPEQTNSNNEKTLPDLENLNMNKPESKKIEIISNILIQNTNQESLSITLDAQLVSLGSKEIQLMHTDSSANNGKDMLQDIASSDSDFSDANPSRRRRRSLSWKRPRSSTPETPLLSDFKSQKKEIIENRTKKVKDDKKTVTGSEINLTIESKNVLGSNIPSILSQNPDDRDVATNALQADHKLECSESDFEVEKIARNVLVKTTPTKEPEQEIILNKRSEIVVEDSDTSTNIIENTGVKSTEVVKKRKKNPEKLTKHTNNEKNFGKTYDSTENEFVQNETEATVTSVQVKSKKNHDKLTKHNNNEESESVDDEAEATVASVKAKSLQVVKKTKKKHDKLTKHTNNEDFLDVWEGFEKTDLSNKRNNVSFVNESVNHDAEATVASDQAKSQIVKKTKKKHVKLTKHTNNDENFLDAWEGFEKTDSSNKRNKVSNENDSVNDDAEATVASDQAKSPQVVKKTKKKHDKLTKHTNNDEDFLDVWEGFEKTDLSNKINKVSNENESVIDDAEATVASDQAKSLQVVKKTKKKHDKLSKHTNNDENFLDVWEGFEKTDLSNKRNKVSIENESVNDEAEATFASEQAKTTQVAKKTKKKHDKLTKHINNDENFLDVWEGFEKTDLSNKRNKVSIENESVNDEAEATFASEQAKSTQVAKKTKKKHGKLTKHTNNDENFLDVWEGFEKTDSSNKRHKVCIENESVNDEAEATFASDQATSTQVAKKTKQNCDKLTKHTNNDENFLDVWKGFEKPVISNKRHNVSIENESVNDNAEDIITTVLEKSPQIVKKTKKNHSKLAKHTDNVENVLNVWEGFEKTDMSNQKNIVSIENENNDAEATVITIGTNSTTSESSIDLTSSKIKEKNIDLECSESSILVDSTEETTKKATGVVNHMKDLSWIDDMLNKPQTNNTIKKPSISIEKQSTKKAKKDKLEEEIQYMDDGWLKKQKRNEVLETSVESIREPKEKMTRSEPRPNQREKQKRKRQSLFDFSWMGGQNETSESESEKIVQQSTKRTKYPPEVVTNWTIQGNESEESDSDASTVKISTKKSAKHQVVEPRIGTKIGIAQSGAEKQRYLQAAKRAFDEVKKVFEGLIQELST